MSADTGFNNNQSTHNKLENIFGKIEKSEWHESAGESQAKKEYTISPITSFDEEEELYFTKVGIKGGDLLYTAWGKTEKESRDRAEYLFYANKSA